MSIRQIKSGTTDVSVIVRIIDSADGTPETGVVYNTSGIDLWYRREGAVSTDITEATLSALTDAHADGGFLHINDGWYRLDLPDAACAAGVTGVQIGGTVTGMVVLAPYIELVSYNPYDAVRLGLTALPNAAADAAGGLPISDAGGLDLDAILADTADMQPKLGAPAGASISADIAAIKSDTAAVLVDTGTDIPAILTTIAGYIDTEVASILTAVDTEVAAIKAVTDNLPNGGALTTITTHLTDIKGATFSGATDSLEAIRDRGDAAWITATGFSTLDAAGVRTAVGLASANLDTQLTAIDDYLDTEVAAIKAKTDLIPASPAATSDIPSAATIASTVLAAGDIDGYSLEGSLKLIGASTAGKLSGAATTTITIRAMDDSKARITATVDADGNRSAVTLDATG